jgi:hypothetical protein
MATVNSYDRPHDAPPMRGMGGQARSTTSILAILAAIGSFVLSARNNGITAFLVALFAIAAGLFGGLKALSPRVSGGMLSLAAVLLGVLAALVGIVVTIF